VGLEVGASVGAVEGSRVGHLLYKLGCRVGVHDGIKANCTGFFVESRLLGGDVDAFKFNK
jgi:hypothetical protein